jgi:hypothetical protein
MSAPVNTTKMTTASTLVLPTVEAAGWPALPTETEIYILPDGRVVIADLPAELAPLAAALGAAEACEIEEHAQFDSTV